MAVVGEEARVGESTTAERREARNVKGVGRGGSREDDSDVEGGGGGGGGNEEGKAVLACCWFGRGRCGRVSE